MDTKTYQFKQLDDVYSSVDVIITQFKTSLEANGCNLSKLKQEFGCLYNHV